MCGHLAYIKSLGVGAMVLEGLFLKGPSPDGPVLNDSLATVPQLQHLLRESSKSGLRVVLDLCDLTLTSSRPEVSEVNPTSVSLEPLAAVQRALKSWLESGVAGFMICDTDPAYSEQTLTEWRLVLKEFSKEDDDRIVMLKQTGELHNSTGSFNDSLVEVVMRAILPPAQHILSVPEVAETVEARLLASEGTIWPSWRVGGRTSGDLQKILLVLMMTLPGTPALQYGEEISNTKNVLMNATMPQNEDVPSSNAERERRLALALFRSLSVAKAREEALLSGTFTMLSFNASSAAANSTLHPPILGFLRSWGCVQFLVLLNIGPEPHPLDPHWARSLPSTGVFVISTGLNRLGSVSLYSLSLQPQEAIVIKLIEARSFS